MLHWLMLLGSLALTCTCHCYFYWFDCFIHHILQVNLLITDALADFSFYICLAIKVVLLFEVMALVLFTDLYDTVPQHIESRLLPFQREGVRYFISALIH